MAHQVQWTRTILDAFAEEAMLSDEEYQIMETRIKGWTVTRQAMYFNKSESAIHSIIKNLKIKYDAAQQNRPDVLPERIK